VDEILIYKSTIRGEGLMKKVIMIASLAIACTSISGCATVFNGNKQKVNVATSNNSKIDVSIDGRNVTVPGVVEVDRKKANLMVATSAKGCTPNTAVSNSIEPIFWVNVLSTNIVGSAVDFATNSMWKYDENIMINCN